jgi:hypothetical protein
MLMDFPGKLGTIFRDNANKHSLMVFVSCKRNTYAWLDREPSSFNEME